MVGGPLLNKMAQTAVDRMDEYLGMKDGPERDFKQPLKDRRDESIGATESDLIDRLFKSVKDAFSPAYKDKISKIKTPIPEGMMVNPRQTMEFRDANQNGIEDRDEGIYRFPERDFISVEEWKERNPFRKGQPIPEVLRDQLEQGKYGLSKGRTFSDNDWGAVLQGADPAALLSEKGETISDRDRAIISGLLSGVRVPPIEEDTETTEVITESPEGAAALDETMQLPSAMDLAQMGMGLGSRRTPPLQEGLGAFGFQPHQLPVPERLSPYEEMLMLLSLGIPGAALGGRAVGGLMRGMKGRPTLPQSPSAMRDMGPQAGNITGGAIALEKLGRPIPGRSGPAAQRILGGIEALPSAGNITAGAYALNPIRSLPGITGRKGLESLKRFMGRENLRRPQVSKMAKGYDHGTGKLFMEPNQKLVFERAMRNKGFPSDEVGKYMYMYSDDVADYFKDTITRKTIKVPK